MIPGTLPARQTFLRPTWAEIDSRAFCRNLIAVARFLRPSVRLIAVLKANGYGHGAIPLAKAAEHVDAPLWGFGVSSVEEGIGLRSAGLRRPILILGSLFPFESFEAALEHDLTSTVASLAAVRAVAKIASDRKRRARVHVKIDTGMGRIGVAPETAPPVLQTVLQSDSLLLEGVYTHLARADSPEETKKQLALFEQVLRGVRVEGPHALLRHAANSAATLSFPESHYDAVRPGLALYGVYPQDDLSPRVDLRPVMTWKTRVVFVKTVRPGTPISYGGTFRVKRPSRLATLPVGYADGYRRAFSNKARVLVKGRRCPVVGRVTMDQTVVDVTDVPRVDVGEEAVLLGCQGPDKVSAEEMARWAETIPYEILCGISGRVPRVVTDTGRAAAEKDS